MIHRMKQIGYNASWNCKVKKGTTLPFKKGSLPDSHYNIVLDKKVSGFIEGIKDGDEYLGFPQMPCTQFNINSKCQSLLYRMFVSVDIDSVLILITIVLLALLNILCRFSLVNIHPRITSNGSRKAFPKAANATFFLSATTPFREVVFRFITLFPID